MKRMVGRVFFCRQLTVLLRFGKVGSQRIRFPGVNAAFLSFPIQQDILDRFLEELKASTIRTTSSMFFPKVRR